MRMALALFLAGVAPASVFCCPGGVLEKVTKIQVEPTVIEQPEKVKDSVAPSLVRYNLRAAVKDARFAEGNSTTRAHIVLDEYSSENSARRLIGLNSGRSISTVDCRLVIEDASGRELANIKIHLRGTVAFSQLDGGDGEIRHATSDLEQRLLKEIEMLK